MKWLELAVEAPPELAEPLSEMFLRYGHGGVAVEEAGGYNPDEGGPAPKPDRVWVKTYLPFDSEMEEKRSRIDLAVRLISQVGPVSELIERALNEEEWGSAWKQHFRPLRVGERMVVVPTWTTYSPRESAVVINLDPGMAFGTGHHPTTRMCMELLEDHVAPGMTVLDVGCGSAILSIAAARLGAAHVVGLDTDATAADVGAANVGVNGVSGSVRIVHGSLPHADAPVGIFDVAVANISSKVVLELAGELVGALRPEGLIIVSGFLLDDADVIAERLSTAGAAVWQRRDEGDWACLLASAV